MGMAVNLRLPRGGSLLLFAGVIAGFLGGPAIRPLQTASADPLVVSPVNPRYFSDGQGAQKRAVYLTGANRWNNLQDGVGFGSCSEPKPPFNFTAYLDFLASHNLNFIRLWRWEHFKFKLPKDLDASGVTYCVAQHPWGGR